MFRAWRLIWKNYFSVREKDLIKMHKNGSNTMSIPRADKWQVRQNNIVKVRIGYKWKEYVCGVGWDKIIKFI